jgi:hypothetical protein
MIRFLKHLALAALLAGVAWTWSRYQIEASAYDYDEADYMFAASRGLVANWSDSPSLALSQFVRIGLSRGGNPSQRSDLSVLIRDSGDMDAYRHWHGPLYYDGLALAPPNASEHSVRVLALAAPLLGLAVIFLGCLWLWPGSQGTLAAVISSLLFLWSPAVIKTTEIAPHILFASVCLAALFAIAKFRETGKRSHWYSALAFCGLAFCTMELSFALIVAVLICGHLERERLLHGEGAADGWIGLAWRSITAFLAPVLVLWPGGLLKLNFIKSYLFMAYLAVFRKNAWGDVTFAQTWSFRFGAMPAEWVALALALGIFFGWRFFRGRDFPGRRQLLVFLIFGAIMLVAVLRVNSFGLRYVLPFFPALLVFTGCVLAAAMNSLPVALRAGLVALLAALIFVDTARQVNTRAPEPDPQWLARLAAVRDPRWQGKTLLIPQGEIPTLHFYFQDITFRGYEDASAIPSRLAAQHFDGVIYPAETAVRVP